MGYLLHILAALLAQGLAESGWTTGWRAPWAVPLLLVVPHALGLASHRAFLAGRFRASSLFLRALTACAPVLHLAALCALGWMDFTREQIGASASLDEWPRLGMLLALAPFVVFEAAAIDARARLVAPYPRERAAWRKFQVRMLLSAIVPLVAYLLLTSAVGANRTLRVEIEEVRLYGAAFALAMVLCLALALPTLLRNVWDTAPIPPGVQRDVLSAVAARAGFRARSLLAWNTGDLMANAAIVGIGARTRIVLFSDSLLSQLDHPELAAVFAHEIGHAARRHVLHFVAWAVGFFLLADLVASRLFAEQLWLGGGFLLAAVAIWLLVFGYVSRRFELEADLFCIDLLGDASALIRALEKVGGHIRDVASWRHFSTAERVRFLADAATDPRAQARLRRTLRIWKRLGVLLLVAAAALQVWTLVGSFREDRLRADLRLGHYGAAVARAREARDLDPALLDLAQRAAELGVEEAGIPEIAARARASLAGGDLAGALAWLELGALRGDPELETVHGAVRALADGEAEAREILAAPELAPWREALDSAARRLPDPR